MVILAGGDGQRLWTLTTDAEGNPVPKQFCRLGGTDTLLERTMRRMAPLAPPERTYVCVMEKHRAYWEPLLRGVLPDENIVVQPQNRGTAAGVLLPLLRVFEHDPDSTVVLTPSDHHVGEPDVFLEAVNGMAHVAERDDSQVVLLGVGAEAPNADYGWIVPRRPRADGTCEVRRFVEKPPAEQAWELWQDDALWNAFVLAGRTSALLDLYRRAASNELRMFSQLLQKNPKNRSLDEMYAMGGSADFSRDVLGPSPEMLRVWAAPPCGWCDLGTPERVLRIQTRLKALAGAAAAFQAATRQQEAVSS